MVSKKDMKKILKYINKHVKMMQFAKFDVKFVEDNITTDGDRIIMDSYKYNEIIYNNPAPMYFLDDTPVQRKDIFRLVKEILSIGD